VTVVIINSSDLETALKVVRATVGSSNDISSHYVFRTREEKLEVLSYDGRTFSSCLVPHTNSDGELSFTVEARRIHVLLDSVGANQTLDLTFSDGEVMVKTARGKVMFSSLDPSLFPYWDDVIVGAKTTAKVSADRLHAAMTHIKQFIYDQEAKNPALCVAEFRNGVLYSTDQMAVSIVKMPGMENCGLRVHVKNLGNVLSFLSTAKGDDVEVLESDRAFFLRRPDGAVFGETVFAHRFPDISVDWNLEDDQEWDIFQEELLDGIKFLQSAARTDEPKVRFNRDGDTLSIAMTSVAGKPLPISISLVEFKQKEGGVTEMPSFALNDGYVGKILNGNTNTKVRLGVSKKGAGGWVRVRDDRGPDTYLTIVAWLKNA
jgi:DNA polymerase III sliding clamp (beta) subunit (PCNA family)